MWHPTSEKLFFTTGRDKQIKMWDANMKSIKPQGEEKTKEENINLAISPDGLYLGVSNVREELTFYDSRFLKPIKTIKQKSDINAFSWDKGDGSLFFITDQNGTITVYDGKSFNIFG